MDEAWSWNKAERQAADIMGDLASWVVSWLDWNLLVDEDGGPSHMGWNCGAAIVTDHTNRHGRGAVVLQPSYYYTGHFSRWVEPGMAVVQTTVELSDAVTDVKSGEWGLMDSDRVAMFPYVSISLLLSFTHNAAVFLPVCPPTCVDSFFSIAPRRCMRRTRRVSPRVPPE